MNIVALVQVAGGCSRADPQQRQGSGRAPAQGGQLARPGSR